VTHKVAEVAESAGISLNVKALRHHTASQLLAGGIDLRNTAARLGHGGGGATTLRHYADPISEVDRRAAAYLAQITAPTGAVELRRRPSCHRPFSARSAETQRLVYISPIDPACPASRERNDEIPPGVEAKDLERFSVPTVRSVQSTYQEEQESRRTPAVTNVASTPNPKEDYSVSHAYDNPRELITVDVTGYSRNQRSIILNAISEAQATLHTAPLEESGSSGWTKHAYDKALVKLAGSRAEVQIEVVKRAVANGGSITRAEVFELGGYPADRQLKGFTRPANRATQALRDSGDLPEDADELLESIYDMAIKGYQPAKGFRVPQELVKLNAE
jgi:hypothetical protein